MPKQTPPKNIKRSPTTPGEVWVHVNKLDAALTWTVQECVANGEHGRITTEVLTTHRVRMRGTFETVRATDDAHPRAYIRSVGPAIVVVDHASDPAGPIVLIGMPNHKG
jgi:hypothetical protein